MLGVAASDLPERVRTFARTIERVETAMEAPGALLEVSPVRESNADREAATCRPWHAHEIGHLAAIRRQGWLLLLAHASSAWIREGDP